MLVWMDSHEGGNRLPTGDAIRTRLIREGSIRTRAVDFSALLEEVKARLASLKDSIDEFRIYEYRRMLENMLRTSEPEIDRHPEGPGAVIARALGIKSLVIDLSASMVSRAKVALASPTVKSIGFYSGLKLDGRNAP